MLRRKLFLLLALAALAWPACGADIVFENARLRAVLGEDAVWRSLVDKATGKEYGARARLACATVKLEAAATQTIHSANRAAFAGGSLALGFADCDTMLTLAVRSEPDWILFTLTGVEGARPAELTLLRIGTTLTQHVGTRLGMGWDDAFAIGLQGANMQTRGQAVRRKTYAELFATTQDAPGPQLEGATVALLAAPTDKIDWLLRDCSNACQLPRNETKGFSSKMLPLAKSSYWFLGFGEKDADKIIDYCRQSGLRTVLLSSGSWCKSPGHYVFNTANYPDGVASLQRTVAKLHTAGILVGMHCFASKISKTDAYVTPVPDRRFWVDRTTTLAAAISATDTSVRTTGDLREWPGSPVARQKTWEGGVTKHQEVIVDDEIIFYDHIGPEDRWDTFLGGKRGAWKTRPAEHAAGTAGRHYGVDGCINGYIIDQETALLDETTTRLADIFNTCDFDMVYFDGGEDVDRRRFDYYVSKFQATAMAKFTKRPLVHMGTILTHHLWHSFTRSATVDTYLNTLHGAIQSGVKVGQWPTVRQHIDKSVRYMQSVGEDRMPGELGWFGIWPKEQNSDGLQLDEIEYLMAKSLAHGAPISLETSFSQMAKHPLTPGILEIVRAYEELRTQGTVPAATREKLRAPQRDFLLVRDGDTTEFIAAAPAPVAGGRDVRAMIGARGPDVVATVWHHLGNQDALLLQGLLATVSVRDIAGQPLSAAATITGQLRVQLGPRRTTLIFPNTTPDVVRDLLSSAKLELHRP
ncbi:MAG: hypothetical protein NTY53_25530 [Kiritimatiellaeota bacterium]|nr:hypothetical protein [Kiritimatiellota bacterium]